MIERLILVSAFVAVAFALPDHTKVPAVYIVLALTMLSVGTMYAIKAWNYRQRADPATWLLMTGIAIAFIGHGLDQSLWSLATTAHALQLPVDLISAALGGGKDIVIVGKSIACLGALYHIRLATFDVHPWLTVRWLVITWLFLWSMVALMLAI